MLDDIDVRFFMMVHDADSVGEIGASDIAVSCPLCREGKSWKRKHRMHLYIKPTWDSAAIHCWNCGYSSNMFGYLKEYHPSEYEHYIKAKRGSGFAELKQNFKYEKKYDANNDKIENIKVDTGIDFVCEVPIKNYDEPDSEETAVSATLVNSIDIGLDMSTPISEIVLKSIANHNPNEPILIEPVKNLSPVPDEVKEYIENRGIAIQKSWLYSPKDNIIRFNDMNVSLSEFIIIPLILKDKWYGFQALAWKQKKFFVYLVTGNSSWKVENWNKINKDEPVFIFESIYDRLSSGIENSIAVLGSNLHEERLKQLKQPIFCLDNQRVDEKAVEETEKYLKAGYKCFIWPKGSEKFKDANDLRKIDVSYEQIQSMINNNIYQGMKGILEIKFID